MDEWRLGLVNFHSLSCVIALVLVFLQVVLIPL